MLASVASNERGISRSDYQQSVVFVPIVADRVRNPWELEWKAHRLLRPDLPALPIIPVWLNPLLLNRRATPDFHIERVCQIQVV
jgi:hypothetical protein